MDSGFCGKVPLHQTNMIQPHGALMIVEKANLQVLQVSENISSLLHKPAADLVQSFLHEHIPPEQTAQLRQRFSLIIQGKIPFSFTMGPDKKMYPVMVQEVDGALVIEIETFADPSEINTFTDVYQELKFVIAAMESPTTVEAASRIMVEELKRISGFDRIMIYRFDADWNGTVIAEALEPSMEPYNGLKFPASDIPKQARELYRISPYRLIPNIDYEPVRLYPVLNPMTHSFTNLSHTNLRSVAQVHLEYLGNMQAKASMSTRILKGGVLWGLISCHHRRPKYLSQQMCGVFELLSDIFSAKIAGIENHASFVFRSGMHQVYVRLVESIYKAGNLEKVVANHGEQLLELLQAEGVALMMKKQVHRFGKTPSQVELEDLAFWLRNKEVHHMNQYAALSEVFEAAAAYTGIASGMLVLPIQPDQGTFLLAFRPEALRNVSWGGNPNEAVLFEPDGKRYHPRASFRQWQETVRGAAVPWEKEELEIAENFRNFVVEYTLNHSKI